MVPEIDAVAATKDKASDAKPAEAEKVAETESKKRSIDQISNQEGAEKKGDDAEGSKRMKIADNQKEEKPKEAETPEVKLTETKPPIAEVKDATTSPAKVDVSAVDAQTSPKKDETEQIDSTKK